MKTDREAGGRRQLISERVEDWAARCPDKVAINEHGTVATYGHAASAARAIHAGLSAASDHANDPVIVLSRSNLVRGLSLVGTLRAGRIFVPVDVSWPRRRIAGIVESSRSAVVLTDAESGADAQQIVGASGRVLDIDQLPPPLEPLESVGDGASLAWIIFTSGSSGAPKGIVQTHRNVVHHASGLCRSLALTGDDRVGVLSPLTAHGGLVYTVAALMAGASVYPLDPRRLTPAAMRAWIAQERLSVLFLVPTVFRALTDDIRASEALSSVRLLRLSGETVRLADTARYRKHFADDCVLSVGFGTTETGGICEAFFRKDTVFDARVPVGTAVGGMQISVVDEHGQDVGHDRPGEIVVTGEYLSPGYWNSPELTAHAFSSVSGTHRRYRTGDRGTMRPDGVLEHIGRTDLLVNVGGQRVELEEIESAMLRIPGVTAAAVVDAGRERATPRLVAFYSQAAGAATDDVEIRQRLLHDLPLVMLPSRVVQIPTLPLTRNGKADRVRLAEIAADLPTSVEPSRDPGALERALTALCAEILDVDRIGVHDNFFDAGGNSMLAALLFSRIEERLGHKVPLAAIALAPTMEQLAAHIERQPAGRPKSCLVPLQPKGRRPPFFCVHGWGGNVVGFYQLAALLGEEQPFYGIQSRGLFGKQFADTSVEAMAATYVDEILSRFPDSAIALGGLSSGGLVAYEMAAQLLAQGRRVSLLALFDTTARRSERPLSLGRVAEWAQQLGDRVRFHLDHLVFVPRDERSLYVRQRLRTLRRKFNSKMWQWRVSTQVEDDATLPDDLFSVREINYLAFKRYRLRTHPGKVTLFKAAEASAGGSRDPEYGWRQHARGGVDVHVVPGNHATFMTEPHIRHLAQTLARCLEAAADAGARGCAPHAIRPKQFT